MQLARRRLLAAVSATMLVVGSAGVAFAQGGGGGGGGQQAAPPTGPHPSQTEALNSALPSAARGAPFTLNAPQIGNAPGTTAQQVVPEGVTPLARDLWNTPNFYLDRAYVTPTDYTD